MSATVKIDQLPILLDELSGEREVKNSISFLGNQLKISILLQVIVFCLLLGILGLAAAFTPNILELSMFDIYVQGWLVLGLFIILARLVSHLIIKLILYLLKLNRFCRVRVVFFVAEEKNSLHRFFWSIIVFPIGYVIIYNQMDMSTEIHESQDKILILLGLMMIGSFAWLMISILLKLHKIKCLNDIYFDRVTKSILKKYVLKMLLSSPEHANQEISKFNDLSQLKKREVTACIVDKLMNMVVQGSLPNVKELDHIDNPIETIVTKSILQNIFKLDFSSRHVESIRKFLLEQSALKIGIFHGDEINEKALHLWVENVYEDRQTLVSDIKKTNIAIRKQHLVVKIAFGVIFIFYIWYFLHDKDDSGQAPAAPPCFSVTC